MCSTGFVDPQDGSLAEDDASGSEDQAADSRSNRALRVSGRQSCVVCHASDVVRLLVARAASKVFFSTSEPMQPSGPLPSAENAALPQTVVSGAARERPSETRASAAERLALVRSGALRLTTALDERTARTHDFLNEALVEKVDTEMGREGDRITKDSSIVAADPWTTTSSRGPWQRMSFLRRLRFAPLATAEYLGATPSPSTQDCDGDAAVVSSLALEWWQLWQQKHAAISASERLYAELLADSRRAAALCAEVRAVENCLVPEGDEPQIETEVRRAASSSSFDGRQAATRLARRRTSSAPLEEDLAHTALRTCCKEIEEQAAEAKSAFKERVKNYPCGRICEITQHLCIARMPEEVEQVAASFESRVDMETREALLQAAEITVAPSVGALADVLSRRLAFWEAEIEENWSQWSAQATAFHDACRGAAEVWQKLRQSSRVLIEKLSEPSAAPSEEVPPIVYLVPLLDYRAVQRHRRWDDAHEALARAAAVLSVLGAWAEYHSLRGDGEVLEEARELLLELLNALNTHFETPRYRGCEMVSHILAADETWCRVQTLAERAWRRRRQLQPCIVAECTEYPWWSPSSWPRHNDYRLHQRSAEVASTLPPLRDPSVTFVAAQVRPIAASP